jgi:hypothetical protein
MESQEFLLVLGSSLGKEYTLFPHCSTVNAVVDEDVRVPCDSKRSQTSTPQEQVGATLIVEPRTLIWLVKPE